MLGHSLEAQAMKCIRYAERHGMVLGPESNSGRPGIFVDAGTSSDKKKSLANRVGGHEMLKAIRPGDTVLITSPSRIWRNLYHSESQLRAWADIGVSLRCVDLDLNFSSANGRIILQIMCAVAEWNNRIRSERTKEGLLLRGKGKAAREETVAEKSAPGQATVTPTWAATLNAIAAFEPEPTPFTGVVRAYCRVSTATQDEQAQVLEIERRLRASPGMENVEIVWYCDHGVSAYKKRLADRPQGRKMLKDLQPGDMVVSLRVDRLIRSLQEMAVVMKQIHDRGSFAWFLDTDLRTDVKQAELMLTILAFAAETESAEASRAILAGQNMARLKGKKVSATPNCMKVLPWDGHTFTRSCSGGALAIFPPAVQVETWFRLH